MTDGTRLETPTAAERPEPGDRVKFADERWRYTVQAVTTSGRYAICTRPFPLRKTVLYTVVDFDEQVRGTDNLIFSRGYDSPEAIETSRDLFELGQVEVSRRNRVPLAIERIDRAAAVR